MKVAAHIYFHHKKLKSMSRKSKILLLVAIAISNFSQAQIDSTTPITTTSGPLECPAPTLNGTNGKIKPSTPITENRSTFKLGEEHKPGSIIYHASYKKGRVIFKFKETTTFKSDSIFLIGYTIKPGENFESEFIFIDEATKKHYYVTPIDNTSAILTDENNIICNDLYVKSSTEKQWTRYHHRKDPFKVNPNNSLEKITNPSYYGTYEYAIKFDSIDGLRISLEVAQLHNDKIIKTKKISQSALKGKINLHAMEISFRTINNNLILENLTEPEDITDLLKLFL